jgi:putative effector of murein hydrolase
MTCRHASAVPLANPVLLAIVAACAILLMTGTDYATYFQGTQFVHVLLGPATVALAVPILWDRMEIKRIMLSMGAAFIPRTILMRSLRQSLEPVPSQIGFAGSR